MERPQQVSAAPDLTSEEDEANSPRLVVDGTGAPTVVWQQRVEALVGGGPDTDVERTAHSASATPGGTWSAPESFGDLSGRGYLDFVVDASGTATAAWLADGRPALLSRRPAGGAWSAPLELETRTDVGTISVAVAADPVGNVVAVWAVDTDEDDDQGLLRARAYDVDGPFVTALGVPASGTAGTAARVLGRGGRRLVADRLDDLVVRRRRHGIGCQCQPHLRRRGHVRRLGHRHRRRRQRQGPGPGSVVVAPKPVKIVVVPNRPSPASSSPRRRSTC